ncbi:Solute carrier family 12 member 9like, partial [Caligus rogercresseyi]
FVAILFLLSYASAHLRYFSWHTCALGLIGTLIMMFLINPVISTAVLCVCIFFFLALSFLSPTKENWGSISPKVSAPPGFTEDHVKFWRPQVLLCVSDPRTHCSLIDFANALKKGGLYVLGHSMEEDEVGAIYPTWLHLVDNLKVKAFVEITLANSIRDGVQQLMRISGLGAMKPNTVIFGFPFQNGEEKKDDLGNPSSEFFSQELNAAFPPLSVKDSEDSLDFVGILNDALKLKKNICICRHFRILIATQFSPSCTAAVKPLAPHPSSCSKWPASLTWCPDGEAEPPHANRAQAAVPAKEAPDLRIKADIILVPIANGQFPSKSMQDGSHLNELLSFHSHETAVTFLVLPQPPRDPRNSGEYLQYLRDLKHQLPPTVLIHGISPVISTTL